eukprot:gnl/MRDRNA2_/MRDRNA2_114585_c0_seq1.p1 gnl/MRDRNA2_/MRDRNA2_114585_c0~~gnl/MRDRNA2_/MRDRNA2_114585_c0_seq1.p1  ORF type:complete len:267 (-),score=65.65 gnl/MRDRNA2_/MRDRNA2_114585_c0_seq1:8-751(-)
MSSLEEIRQARAASWRAAKAKTTEQTSSVSPVGGTKQAICVDDDDDDNDGVNSGTAVDDSTPTPSSSQRRGRAARRSANAQSEPKHPYLAALDRALKDSYQHVKMVPSDAHQTQCLRKARVAIEDSLNKGNKLSIEALKVLKGVGNWVVKQIEENMERGDGDPEPGCNDKAAKRQKLAEAAKAAAPTPNSFTWWYMCSKGQRVEERSEAQVSGPPGNRQYRVSILHSSGRLERAWLPESKAQARSPP